MSTITYDNQPLTVSNDGDDVYIALGHSWQMRLTSSVARAIADRLYEAAAMATDTSHCRWCGHELTFEDDGDAENGPHLSASCDNPYCPGDPHDPQPYPPDYDPEDDANSELTPGTGDPTPRRRI